MKGVKVALEAGFQPNRMVRSSELHSQGLVPVTVPLPNALKSCVSCNASKRIDATDVPASRPFPATHIFRFIILSDEQCSPEPNQMQAYFLGD